MTSGRWFKKSIQVNPDKIICWEHPNFADQIITELDQFLQGQALVNWSLCWVPSLAQSLIIRFKYRNPGE